MSWVLRYTHPRGPNLQISLFFVPLCLCGSSKKRQYQHFIYPFFVPLCLCGSSKKRQHQHDKTKMCITQIGFNGFSIIIAFPFDTPPVTGYP
jgi:hypothetical protein